MKILSENLENLKFLAENQTFEILKLLIVLRILKLFRYFSYSKVVERMIKKTFSNFISVAFVLLLILFIFSLLGMELFKEFKIQENKFIGIEFNFESFPAAFSTCFNLITLNNWYDMIILGYKFNSKLYYIFYTFSLIFLGNFVILNLFIALMLEGFENLDSYETEKKEEIENEIYQTLFKNIHPDEFESKSNSNYLKKSTGFYTFINQRKKDSFENSNSIILEDISDFDSECENAYTKLKTFHTKIIKQIDLENLIKEYNSKSLLFFSKNSNLRMFCTELIDHTIFDIFVNFFIICSLIILSLETFNEGFFFKKPKFLNIFVLITNSGFCLESLIKIISFGFIFEKKAYLRDPINFIEFFVIIFLFLEQANSSISKFQLKEVLFFFFNES